MFRLCRCRFDYIAHSGITSERLEAIEERLKDDIREELKRYDGRLLLHIEQSDGSIVPVWEQVEPEDVKTLREVMVEQSGRLGFSYRRLVRIDSSLARLYMSNDARTAHDCRSLARLGGPARHTRARRAHQRYRCANHRQ